MRKSHQIVATALLLAITACASPPKTEPETPAAAVRQIPSAERPRPAHRVVHGVTSAQALKGLTDQFQFKDGDSRAVPERVARAKGSKAVLKLTGPAENLRQVVLTIPTEVSPEVGITIRSTGIANADFTLLQKILRNLAPKWKEREHWLESAIKSLGGEPTIKTVGPVHFEIKTIGMAGLMQFSANISTN